MTLTKYNSYAQPGRFSSGIVLLLILFLAGCTTLPPDLGRSDVDTLISERGKPVEHQATEAAAKKFVSSLTASPLTPDGAIRIALVNNPQLQAAYAQLGFAAADVYAAGRVRNPVFSASLLFPNVPTEANQLTLGLVTSFTDLITMSSRKRLSAGAFAALKSSIGAEILQVAAAAERALYLYAGAQQVEALRNQVALAAALSAGLAERFFEAGNMKARELALERAAASEARLEALDAAAETQAARTTLATVLGLSSGSDWTAQNQLYLPVTEEDELDTLLSLAFESRLDLEAAQTNAEVLADRLGITNWSRWLGELDVGVSRERETDGSRITGPELAWELPVFNQHQDAMLRAEAELKIAIAEVRRLTIAVDNSVRLAHAELQNARLRIAEYQQELIPQRVEAVARAQEEVNFMLIGVFELIVTKQQEYAAYQGYLEAIRDYWVVRADLSLAAGNTLPSSAAIGEQRVETEDFLNPQPADMNHSGHGAMKMEKDMEMNTKTGEHESHQAEKNGDQP
ncbi:MAG: TolC family protein [Xanthomonadales bacterium]|nr:TolC family protein [Xanthomonadales bacterium]